MILAVQLIRRVKRGGVIVAGPPCSSWVFMNRATARRSCQNPLGDPGSMRVQVQSMSPISYSKADLRYYLSV
jgi:hypothetical protein